MWLDCHCVSLGEIWRSISHLRERWHSFAYCFWTVDRFITASYIRKSVSALTDSITTNWLLQVEDIHLVTDPWTKESRGFGFVTMSSLEEADRCIKYLNRSVLEGRVITVEKVYTWHSLFYFCPLPLSRLLSYPRRSAFPQDWYSFKHCNHLDL